MVDLVLFCGNVKFGEKAGTVDFMESFEELGLKMVYSLVQMSSLRFMSTQGPVVL